MPREATATEKMKREALIAAAARQGTPILCAICGKPIMPGQRMAFDHGHAVGRGGPNTVANLFPVHDEKAGEFDCHTRKTAHPRGKHTAIGGDTFEAAKTPRIAPSAQVNKPPIGTERHERPTKPWASRKIQARANPWPPKGTRKFQSREKR